MAHRNFARAMRRKTQWAGYGAAGGGATLPILVSVAGGATAILSQAFIIAGAAGVVDEETTVTRMIGRVTATMGVDTAILSTTFAIGCLVVRNEALAAGVGSMASPVSDPDAEWLYYTTGLIQNPQNVLRDGPIASLSFDFDVRG